jgi:hypothetical protein
MSQTPPTIDHKLEYQLNMMNAAAKRALLGTLLKNIQSSTGTNLTTITGDVTFTSGSVSAIAAAAVTAPKIKIVNRTLIIAIGAKTATVTNAADINGAPLAPYIASATLDATLTAVTSFQFVASTGQIIVNGNANATAAVNVVVPIIQAS